MRALIHPGSTSAPPASITFAPGGTATWAPTLSMFPSRMTIVPRSIAGLVTGTIFALVIATTPVTFRWTLMGGAGSTPGARTADGFGAACAATGAGAWSWPLCPAACGWGRGVSSVGGVGRRSVRSAAISCSFSLCACAIRCSSACRW